MSAIVSNSNTMKAAASDDAAVVAPGRPMFRKGQDSRALTEALRQILRRVRGR